MQKNAYEYAYSHTLLGEVMNKLAVLQFLDENRLEISNEFKKATSLTEEDVTHSAMIASFLALSTIEKHRQKALAFAILLYLRKKDYLEYASFCYIIFSRTGNIQLGKHLSQLFDETGNCFKVVFDEVLNAELSAKRSLSVLKIANLPRIYLSDFQKSIWKELQTSNRIIGVTGPTSSGKSHVIQSYVVQLSKRKRNFKILYIVPTRALISEVSRKLRKSLFSDNVSVKIAVGYKREEKEREVLVLTPERSLKLLHDDYKDENIDLIFCDEFQKIEDPERGVLLEYALCELINRYKKSKVVIAGPYLRNLKETIGMMGRFRSDTIESELTPVYQLKSIFAVPSRKYEKISVTIKEGFKKNIPTSILIDRPTDYKVTRQSEIVANIVKKYSASSNNVIYAPTRAKAEEIALSLASIVPEKNDENLKELIELLEKEISPDFSLARCLKHGVAFHHSMIPEMAKLEIEEFYREGVINNVSCTTTLLEGVNLPADRVFIYRPWKRDSKHPLTGFDFGNLIGRAGRADVRLSGSVCCIEIGKDKWADRKLDSDPRKELVPATSEAISKENTLMLEQNADKHSVQMFYDNVKPATVFTMMLLRQKALKDKADLSNELPNYLKRKQLSYSQANKLSATIGQSVTGLDIPYRITKLNPTIDPLLQNVLYKKILSDPKGWIINKRVKDGLGEKFREFKDKSFYYQFQDIVMRLDDIFRIESIITSKHRYKKWYRSPNVYTLTHYAVTWIEQKQLSWIIKREQEEEEGKDKRAVDDLKKIQEAYRDDPARLEME